MGPTPCENCGRDPVAFVEFNAHTGMLLWWRSERRGGLLCKPCGTGLFRKQMNHTLAWGWFGVIAFFANFYAIGKNLLNRRKLQVLTDPILPLQGVAGRPLVARYGLYVGVAVLAILGTFIVVDVLQSPAEELSGSCLRMDGDEILETRCSEPHDAKVVAVLPIDGGELCRTAADDAIVLVEDESHVLCLDYDG